jgi:hypothetical protein
MAARPPRSLVAAASAVVGIVVVCAPQSASASSQISASGQIGVVGVGEGSFWGQTKLDLGLRFEDVYLRESPRDFGLGPFLETRTAAFVYGDYGGGLMAVLPVDPTFPIWLGVGGFARRQDATWAPGANAFLAWGGRSYNYSSSYAMAFGLVLDVRVHGGDHRGVDTVLAASIDFEGIALPFIYLASAIRGG